ncbi:MAG: S-adenosylmethionine synthase [Candidatus Woesearchaeota archaeon]|nr:S-adenosylmethionine synthase [Candidatus Woesearchaeota archaeon]
MTNKRLELIVHSFEAGRRGKPDELDAGIAHLIGAYFLQRDKDSRFDIRVTGGYNKSKGRLQVTVSGEVSDYLLCGYEADLRKLVVDYYNYIHLTSLCLGEILIEFRFNPQSSTLASNGTTGDSGNPIAVAYANTPNCLPWERHLAVEIRDLIDNIFHNNNVPQKYQELSGVDKILGLKADGKVGVDAYYSKSRLHSVNQISVAVEHRKDLKVNELRNNLGKVIRAYLEYESVQSNIDLGNPRIMINGLGDWNTGGWYIDEGTRDAKPYRDGFSTYGVNVDSFSGEDPSKPSATGTMLARHIAVQIVANQLADFARVSLNYTIGSSDVGLNIWTNNTSSIPQEKLEQWVRENFSLTITDARKSFDLRNPNTYREIVRNSDFFHNPNYAWNTVLFIK